MNNVGEGRNVFVKKKKEKGKTKKQKWKKREKTGYENQPKYLRGRKKGFLFEIYTNTLQHTAYYICICKCYIYVIYMYIASILFTYIIYIYIYCNLLSLLIFQYCNFGKVQISIYLDI